jgi:hypothetical protein
MGSSASSKYYDPEYEKSRECRNPHCKKEHVFAGFGVPHKHVADPDMYRGDRKTFGIRRVTTPAYSIIRNR